VKDDDVRQRIRSGDQDALTEFTRGMLGDEIREGFVVALGRETQHGLRVRVVDERVEIDLTDDAITELLARHLLPRFRAVMRGD
jgi:V/A-type H+-transporting ATPase subunit E